MGDDSGFNVPLLLIGIGISVLIMYLVNKPATPATAVGIYPHSERGRRREEEAGAAPTTNPW